MPERFFTWKKKRQALKDSPYHGLLKEMADHLEENAYCLTSVRNQLRAVVRFCGWLRKRKKTLAKASFSDAESFFRTLPTRRFLNKTRPGVLLALKLSGKNPPQLAEPPVIQAELDAFAEYLRRHKGHGNSTIHYRCYYLKAFLLAKFHNGPIDVSRLSADDVREYVLSQREYFRPQTLNGIIASTLRAYFKFIFLRGGQTGHLMAAIPKFRTSRHCLSPIVLSDSDLQMLWSCFDRSTANGMRGYAAARCMADLGMRVSDVTLLKLDDIRWRQAEIRIANKKAGNPVWLPLPQETGDALADYIRHGRPESSFRHIFLRHNGPRGIPGTTSMLLQPLRRTMAKMGRHEYCGGHLLRHTAATRMRCGGATLKAMADVLGHRSVQTTTQYAQLDLPALHRIAQPWPEGSL